jgi:phosphoglycerate dehydrogenase-like enzyme
MRLLILHDRPELYLDLIETQFAQVEVTICRAYAEAAAAIEQSRPDCILAYKFEGTPYPREAIFAAPTVKWVHNGGAGVDHLLPWDPGRVAVTNSSGIAADVMAQFVLGSIFALNFRFPLFFRQQLARIWRAEEVLSAAGRTLLVVGLGRIGTAIARRAKAFDMTVWGIKASPRAVAGVDQVFAPEGLPQAVAQADYVVLCLPRIPATEGLIDAAVIEAMKPGAYLINVARGGIVDEEALIDALRDGHLGGAVLDVFATEPLAPESPFWDLDNVIISPHASTVFAGWERAAAEVFCSNLGRFLDGRPLVNLVDPARGY